MELGIPVHEPLICAESRGLARERAEALANEGDEVTIAGGGRGALETTPADIRNATGARVRVEQGDISIEDGCAAALPRQTVRRNLTINGSLPGCFMADRIMSNFACSAEQIGQSVEQLMQERAEKNPAGGLGDPEEFGAMRVFLRSRHVGYITGQNIPVDGGSFRSTI